MTGSRETQRWSKAADFLGGLPFAAGVFTLIMGAYVGLVAFGNVTDTGTNWPFIQHVLSMDTVNFGDGPNANVAWRAVTSEPLQVLAYIGVIVWEIATATALLVGGFTWMRALGRGSSLELGRRIASLGFVMVLALFFLGFLTIGGEFFYMWSSSQWNGTDPAFRNTVLASLVCSLCISLKTPRVKLVDLSSRLHIVQVVHIPRIRVGSLFLIDEPK